MSDGMYEAYRKYVEKFPKDHLFPQEIDAKKIKNYVNKIISYINFHIKGNDNSTVTIIKVPFTIKEGESL